MHADLSRSTFRPERHYSAVVAQQGRVQLDADLNEQTAIQLHQARSLAADLIGPHGGPRDAAGFRIEYVGGKHEIDTLVVHGGRYYVDGILCDADRPAAGVPATDEESEESAQEPPEHWTYWDQPDGYRDPEKPGDRLPSPAQTPFLVYLNVWERSVSAAEDPALREVALGAAMPDTAARVKVVWQVLALSLTQLEIEESDPSKEVVRAAFTRWAQRQSAPSARLAARSERPDHADEDPCLVKPDARYRGPENQLYRVEVHEGGEAKDATFKWSRENGSVVFPVDDLDGTWVQLASLGHDDKLDLDVGDHVEFTDTAYASRLEPLPLLRVEELDLPGRRVRLSAEPDPGVGRLAHLNPYLRRWDHRGGPKRKGRSTDLRGGAIPVTEGEWLPLEDGVEVYFAKGGAYRTGDHWIVPARTATGSVEWPVDPARRPLLRGPAGIARHFAPLALIKGEGSAVDLRLAFGPLASSMPAADEATLAAEEQARREELAAEDPSQGRSQTTAEAEAAVEGDN
ncbi:hypothetical protein GCM10010313_21670 [Streptomyces violarus]|uniref:Uncharacterized protein n=1 Tax=Streptomyces violarus TaxID=67380 RepID=A0A7W4ZTL4_9ACTN|nr:MULTISPECIES: DUF6519 domain-containing protein [Streptomyces]MBB3078428.1 hypothetical protein [Streptomyces violarus]WRU02975.1 DUF6519 domain-containing protein [Streptomyces sp. CGMCC 4.1772]GHD05208.1 hypothetical protein GCM10010313_21670 [Streptomyces violarus]